MSELLLVYLSSGYRDLCIMTVLTVYLLVNGWLTPSTFVL